MSSNQLIQDEEISNVHVRKVFGISKVAKSNSYKDLDDIPETFPPAEHSSSHPVVSEDKNGMITPDIKKKIKNTVGFHTLNVKYNVEPKDSKKGYTDLDIFLELSELTLSDDTMSELEVDEADKIIKIIGTSLDPNIYKPVKGDQGDPGDKGLSSYWWKPSVDENGFISWSLEKSNVPDGYTLNIKGTKGLKGETGYDGANVFFDKVLNNIYTIDYNLRLRGEMVQFTKDNDSDSIGFFKSFKILDDNMSIISKEFQLDRCVQLYGDNLPEYLYCIQTRKFYKYNSSTKTYDTYNAYNFSNFFTYNNFIYDKRLNNFMYISVNNRFIGV